MNLLEVGPLLPGWKAITFGDLFDVQGGSQPAKSNFVYEPTPGYVRLLQIRDFGLNPVPTYVREDSVTKFCKKNDVLVARYGASLGRILTGMEGAYNVALARIIPKNGNVAPRYLFYLLQTQFFQQPIHMISRSAQNGFNKGELEPIVFPIAPPDIQNQIAGKIDSLFAEIDAGVEDLKRTKGKLELYKQSVLNAAIQGKLVPQDPTDEPASKLLARIRAEKAKLIKEGKLKKEKPLAPIDTSEIPFEIPKGWEWVRLRNLVESLKYGTSQKCDYGIKGIPVLRIPNVVNGSISIDDLKFTQLDKSALSELQLCIGDVLIVRSNGSINLVGRTAIVDEGAKDMAYAGYLIRGRPIFECVNPEYIHLCLQSITLRQQIEDLAKSTSGVNNISAAELASLLLPLPPLAEQIRLLLTYRFISTNLEESTCAVTDEISRSAMLRQSILKSAFEGNLL